MEYGIISYEEFEMLLEAQMKYNILYTWNLLWIKMILDMEKIKEDALIEITIMLSPSITYKELFPIKKWFFD